MTQLLTLFFCHCCRGATLPCNLTQISVCAVLLHMEIIPPNRCVAAFRGYCLHTDRHVGGVTRKKLNVVNIFRVQMSPRSA
ncbi:hypothetical protein PR003_g28043 [Phytophthora rubi]|uniref:Secreted protein n=1 Tax=Phytophthora rubi TaxID=129364 RepID=A0A6A4BV44_9STRA|nr:hypothetical protein PR002_g29317 [Phytophthora rubi]KAE8971240.1 hypothetical protein PR001_g26948 [Phytophthora rubi]KAE9280129.1 hypothetical protein PR003_g28043 [Phytophthora rubi]